MSTYIFMHIVIIQLYHYVYFIAVMVVQQSTASIIRSVTCLWQSGEQWHYTCRCFVVCFLVTLLIFFIYVIYVWHICYIVPNTNKKYICTYMYIVETYITKLCEGQLGNLWKIYVYTYMLHTMHRFNIVPNTNKKHIWVIYADIYVTFICNIYVISSWEGWEVQ